MEKIEDKSIDLSQQRIIFLFKLLKIRTSHYILLLSLLILSVNISATMLTTNLLHPKAVSGIN